MVDIETLSEGSKGYLICCQWISIEIGIDFHKMWGKTVELGPVLLQRSDAVQAFQLMAAQLSKKAAHPLAKILATGRVIL